MERWASRGLILAKMSRFIHLGLIMESLDSLVSYTLGLIMESLEPLKSYTLEKAVV